MEIKEIPKMNALSFMTHFLVVFYNEKLQISKEKT